MKISHILAITLPISITFWSLTALYSPKEITQLPSPIRWLSSVSIPLVVTLEGHRKKSLDASGAAVALIVGLVLTLSNYCFTVALLTFFITSSRATHFKKERKRVIDDQCEAGVGRNWLQVICNGGVATHLALFFLLENGPGEIAIDFTARYNLSWWCISVLGSICCANGDTWASELGTVLSGGDPFLITSFRRVPRGTNGGVSLIGLLVSALGGLVVAAAYYLTEWVCIDSHQWHTSPAQFKPILLMGIIAGFLGSLIDSLIGATLQYSGWDKRKRKVVEYRGKSISDICGRAILDNHAVNLLSNMITAILSPRIALFLYKYF